MQPSQENPLWVQLFFLRPLSKRMRVLVYQGQQPVVQHFFLKYYYTRVAKRRCSSGNSAGECCSFREEIRFAFEFETTNFGIVGFAVFFFIGFVISSNKSNNYPYIIFIIWIF